MKRYLTILGLLIIGLSPGIYAETPTTMMKQRVIKMLQGYEKTPTADDFRRLGDACNDALISIYQDDTLRPIIRARALGCLAYFPTTKTFQVLVSVSHSEENEVLFRRIALKALGVGFREQALDSIVIFLDHEDQFIREAVVYALSYINSPHVRRLLMARLDNEKTIMVRQAIETVLAKSQ